MYNRVRFEWDEEKNRENQRKHDGLSFRAAALIFEDSNVVFRKDRVIEGQQRWHAIGIDRKLGTVLLVVHTHREDNANCEEIIRIISAREASQRERRIYFQQALE